MREVIINSILYGFDKKINFIEGCSRFKFNNLGPAVGMALRFYSSMVKGLKLEVRKLWRLNLAFVGVTVEKLVVEYFASLPPPPPMLSRIVLNILLDLGFSALIIL